MEKYKIRNATGELAQIFINNGYTEKTIVDLKRNIQKVVDLHQKNGDQFYNADLVTEYISEITKKYHSDLMSRTQKNALIKAASYVHSIATTGNVAAGFRETERNLPHYYSNILGRIDRSENWSAPLKRNIRYAAHTYFLYLADNDVRSVSEISADSIRRYIMYCADRMTSNSLDTIR